MPEFQFSGLMNFLDMGGYALYVWPVYLLFALFFVICVIPPVITRRRILRQLRARLAREEHDQ